MNQKTKDGLYVTILVGIFVMAVAMWKGNFEKGNVQNSSETRIEQHVSYVGFPYEQQIGYADIIFAGKLINISATRWNQDSGEYWEKTSLDEAIPLQYHTLTFEVSKIIIDKIGSTNQNTIEITVLGISPLDGKADHELSLGDSVVVFAQKTNLAWRNNNQTMSVLEIVTSPSLAFFIQEKSGSGLYKGKVIHDLGKGNFETVDIALPIQDLTTQIRDINLNQSLP